jgi:hypothetical protein
VDGVVLGGSKGGFTINEAISIKFGGGRVGVVEFVGDPYYVHPCASP